MNHMWKVFKVLVLSFLGQMSFAQQTIPILKANSPKVAIKDGWEGKTKYWNHLLKSQSPILYPLAKNGTRRQVVFYTDIDSNSIAVETDSDYLIKVIINNSDTCNIILSTKNIQFKKINNKINGTDTLPFTLNKNKQIIIRGSINKSPKMDFCFDLGARMVYVIGKDLDKLNNLILDGLIEDESVTGLSTEKTSCNNSLQLGNLNITGLPICYIDEAGFLENGGGLIGFNVFQNKVLEIDFDNELLIVQNSLPEKAKTYAQIEFKQTTGGLYIPIKINNGRNESKGWYFFDTGADNALTFDSKFAKREGFSNTMKVIGKAGIASSESRIISAAVLEVPEVSIADFKIKNVPTLLAEESNAEAKFEDGVIGIGLQSRFNFIIDYPSNKMYLKPSKYFTNSFEKKDRTQINIVIGISLCFGILLMFYLVYKRVKIKARISA